MEFCSKIVSKQIGYIDVYCICYLNSRDGFFGLNHPSGFGWLTFANQLR